MASSFSALLLAGGFGASAAFLLGLAFAHTAYRLIGLGAVGAVLTCSFQLGVGADELASPLARELLNAAGIANALGWFAGTLLVARLRAVEWLERLDAQEAS